MSERHPIIAITGSSGAGTTSVTRTFENIFRREGINAAIIEGDSFHRHDRREMKARQAEAEQAGDRNFSHFGPENNLFQELAELFSTYGRTGGGQRRKYLHDREEAAPAGRDKWGNHMSYGVREFGMAAVMNGIALHGGYLPYAGTFLTFSDYSRNAIRMAALMKLRVIHVFTHDSIGLGEDGPTHQSVEHVPSLRIIPNLDLWRPADGLETAVAWACAIERSDGPTVLALCRQNVPRLVDDAAVAQRIRRGGYVLSDMADAQAVILATGSETSLAMAAQATLATEGIATRVVSMPCTTVFDRQADDYREVVLPPELPAVAVEAAHPDFWRKYVGRSGIVIGMSTFGESAPARDLYEHFGITGWQIAKAVRSLVHPSSRQTRPQLVSGAAG